MRISFLGHSGFLLELPSATLLFDWSEGGAPDFEARAAPAGLCQPPPRGPFPSRNFSTGGCGLSAGEGRSDVRQKSGALGRLAGGRCQVCDPGRWAAAGASARRASGDPDLYGRGRCISGDSGRPDCLSCRGSELVALGGGRMFPGIRRWPCTFRSLPRLFGANTSTLPCCRWTPGWGGTASGAPGISWSWRT